jgi:hypothetical protein
MHNSPKARFLGERQPSYDPHWRGARCSRQFNETAEGRGCGLSALPDLWAEGFSLMSSQIKTSLAARQVTIHKRGKNANGTPQANAQRQAKPSTRHKPASSPEALESMLNAPLPNADQVPGAMPVYILNKSGGFERVVMLPDPRIEFCKSHNQDNGDTVAVMPEEAKVFEIELTDIFEEQEPLLIGDRLYTGRECKRAIELAKNWLTDCSPFYRVRAVNHFTGEVFAQG